MDSFSTRVLSPNYDYAVYEQAYSYLEPDQRMVLQQAGVTDFSVGRTSETYRRGRRDPHICPKAWYFLQGPGCKVGGLR